MNILKRLLKEKPNTKKIDLSVCQLEEIDSLIETLYKFKNLQELNISHNNLEHLPTDLSILKRITTINVSNNLFKNNGEVVRSLKTIPKLTSLKIKCTPSEENAIIKEMPRLESINKKVLRKKSLGQAKTEELKVSDKKLKKEKLKELLTKKIRLSNEDKEEPQIVLSCLEKTIAKNELQDQFPRIRVEYQKAYNEILSYNRAMERKNLSNFEHSIETINHRCNLLEPLFKPLIDITSFYSEDLAAAFRNVFSFVTNNNDDWHQYAIAAAYSLDGKGASVYGGRGEDIGINGKKRLDLMGSLNNEKEVWLLRKHELEDEMSNLRAENKRCYDLIIKLSKNGANNQLEVKKLTQKRTRGPSLSAHKIAGKRADTKEKVNPQKIRMMTHQQLMDFIADIMKAKKVQDKRNRAAGIPRETMEQFLYTYLTNKYGLKNLVIEWASTIINMIAQFSSTNADILLFGKILRNEVDEEFYDVHVSVKNTINEMLEAYLRSKYPLKSAPELKRQVQKRKDGFISKTECEEILSYMYDEKDFNSIKLILEHEFAKGQTSVSKMLKSKIQWKDFLKITLDYQLQLRETYLNRYNELFLKIDRDGDGILNKNEYKFLVDEMRSNNTRFNMVNVLKAFDPIESGQTTYSTTVYILSKNKVEDSEESILDKFTA